MPCGCDTCAVLDTPADAHEAATRALRGCALFQEVDDASVGALASSCRWSSLARGEVLFHRGDESLGFFVVASGSVKLSVTAPDGRERVIEVIAPGQSFAEATIFTPRPYPVTASALEPVHLLSVPAAPVLERIERDPVLARQMLSGLSMRLHSLVRDIAATSLETAAGRLIGYLLAEAREVGDESGAYVVDLRVSKQLLASRLGLRPETLSRALSKLSADDLVVVSGQRVTVPDLAALRSHAAS